MPSRREGYLVKRNALPPQLCSAARDLLWSTNDSKGMLDRANPESWVGPLPDAAFAEAYKDAPGDNLGAFGWQVRSIGSHPILLELLPDACLEMAEQLLGRGTLLPTQTQAVGEGEPMVGKYCRGCYCNFPKPEGSPRSIKDGHT